MSKENTSKESDYRTDPALIPSLKDGVGFSVMAGAGEIYLVPFGIFLKASSLQIGLLSSFPLLIGALFQSLSVWLMERIPSRRTLIVCGASFQALIWIPILLIPMIFERGILAANVLLVLVVIYQIAFNSTIPAWNSLIGDLVPIETRGSFFGFRNKRNGLWAFIALVFAGQVLHFFEQLQSAALGFVIIFLIAAIGRVYSAYWLSKYPDVPYRFDDSHRFTFLQFLAKTPRSNFARFVFFFGLMNFSAFVAAPYFSVYMLDHMKMSYFDYTVIISVATITQFLTNHYWGTLTDRFGNKKIMSVCGIGVAIVPFVWCVWSNTFVLAAVQAFAGFVWAGFNLAGANFVFDAVSPPKRARCVAYQSLINATFIVAGSIIGAYLADSLPNSLPLSQGLYTPESPFIRIFLISGLLRLLTVVLFLRMFSEVREVENIRHRDLIFRITSLRPLSGVTFGLVTGLRRKARKDRSQR